MNKTKKKVNKFNPHLPDPWMIYSNLKMFFFLVIQMSAVYVSEIQ